MANAGQFSKENPRPGPGRPKGVPNKMATKSKDWLATFSTAYLTGEDPNMTLYADLMAMEPTERVDRIIKLLPIWMPKEQAEAVAAAVNVIMGLRQPAPQTEEPQPAAA